MGGLCGPSPPKCCFREARLPRPQVLPDQPERAGCQGESWPWSAPCVGRLRGAAMQGLRPRGTRGARGSGPGPKCLLPAAQDAPSRPGILTSSQVAGSWTQSSGRESRQLLVVLAGEGRCALGLSSCLPSFNCPCHNRGNSNCKKASVLSPTVNSRTSHFQGCWETHLISSRRSDAPRGRAIVQREH